MTHLNRSYTLAEAINKLEYYCSYQERCHKEVQNKLEGMHMIPAACDQIIVHLIEHDYLNEERYARSYARGKFRVKYWGRHRIKNELRYRGISPANIKLAMEEIPSDEYYTRLDELARRKLTSISSDNLQKKRRKLANYLQYRGWESALVYDKINELIPF